MEGECIGTKFIKKKDKATMWDREGSWMGCQW
jgi:hypothetical protein